MCDRIQPIAKLEIKMTHLLVDTETGLRIVKANCRNFFNHGYAVQFVGTEEQCKAEKKRLKNLNYGD